MICVIDTRNITAFERKYMITEADDDERQNVRRITIATNDGSQRPQINGSDAGNDDVDLDNSDTPNDEDLDAEEPEGTESIEQTGDQTGDVDTEPDDTENEEEQNTQDDQTQQNTEDTPPQEDTPPEENQDGEETVTTGDATGDVDTEPDDAVDAEGGETPDENQTGENDDDDVATEPDDEDTDGEADEDTQGADDGEDTDTGDENTDGEEGDDDTEEAIHKRALFKKYQELHTTLEKYIAQLDQYVGKTDELNRQVREVNDDFKHLRDFIYDWMIIKFKDASYPQSMLFYQRGIASTNLLLDILESIRKKEEKL